MNNVLVLSPELDSAGGIQRYTKTLVRALEGLVGISRIHVLPFGAPQPNGFGSQRVSLSAKSSYVLRVMAAAIRRKPDLVICTHAALAPVGAAVKSATRSLLWVTLHGIEVWRTPSPWGGWGLQRADRLLAVSQFTGAVIVRICRVRSARITILPNAVDGHLLEVAPDYRRLVKLNLVRRRILLTVGRLASTERYKGHDCVIDALPDVVRRVPGVLYLVAGDGNDRPRLEERVRELRLDHHVVFLGQVTDAELAACYRTSDVFILPARIDLNSHRPKGEGFGIVLLEAMAFGRPVIGPNCGAPVEYVRHGEHGLLVNPDNPCAIAEAVVELLMDPARAHRMGEAGRQFVAAEFSYGRFYERLHLLLGEVAG